MASWTQTILKLKQVAVISPYIYSAFTEAELNSVDINYVFT